MFHICEPEITGIRLSRLGVAVGVINCYLAYLPLKLGKCLKEEGAETHEIAAPDEEPSNRGK